MNSTVARHYKPMVYPSNLQARRLGMLNSKCAQVDVHERWAFLTTGTCRCPYQQSHVKMRTDNLCTIPACSTVHVHVVRRLFSPKSESVSTFTMS